MFLGQEPSTGPGGTWRQGSVWEGCSAPAKCVLCAGEVLAAHQEEADRRTGSGGPAVGFGADVCASPVGVFGGGCLALHPLIHLSWKQTSFKDGASPALQGRGSKLGGTGWAQGT